MKNSPFTVHNSVAVCFGMITPARVLVVDSLPTWNTGAISTGSAEFISDDAAIVAGLLSAWDVPTELIGSALGDDDAGRRTVRRLREMGVRGNFELRSDIETPFEINVSDSLGGRTYIWDRRPEVLATLDDADLSPIAGAKLLYVDWYDAPHIVRAMKAAEAARVPVMLNLEHGHSEADALSELVPRATICQAVTDAAQIETNAESVARLLVSQRRRDRAGHAGLRRRGRHQGRRGPARRRAGDSSDRHLRRGCDLLSRLHSEPARRYGPGGVSAIRRRGRVP